jgi:hypothetical protein
MKTGEKKVIEMHSSDLTAALTTILDTFTGEDGGVSFVLFCGFIRELDRQAAEGDQAAAEVTNVVRRFARLIELAMPKVPKKGGKR